MAFEIAMMGEGKLYSSNLSSHETGLANWSDEQIVAAITQMKKRGGGLIEGPMARYQRGLFGLSDEDSAGIVAFLRSLPAIDNVVPESTFKPHAAPPRDQ